MGRDHGVEEWLKFPLRAVPLWSLAGCRPRREMGPRQTPGSVRVRGWPTCFSEKA